MMKESKVRLLCACCVFDDLGACRSKDTPVAKLFVAEDEWDNLRPRSMINWLKVSNCVCMGLVT